MLLMLLMRIHKTARGSIARNRAIFERMQDLITCCRSPVRRLLLAQFAAWFAARCPTGYYYAPLIEKALIECADLLPYKSHSTPTPRGVLHIMTRGYKTGGHTRVVERWVEQSLPNEIHSVVFTTQYHQHIPIRLRLAVEKTGGKVFVLSGRLPSLRKAADLRHIAIGFERIVIHAHMYDVLPLLAFGSTEFSRPVIHYNHADHCFWLGSSIADIVAETRQWGANLSRNMRGIKSGVVLGIPINTVHKPIADKTTLRAQLGLAQNKKIIITVGAAYKFRSCNGSDLSDIITLLLQESDDLQIIAIGPTLHDLCARKKAAQSWSGRLFTIGEQSPELLQAYIGAADLALDSFPISGGTTLIDLIHSGCPTLALRSPVGHLDYTIGSVAYCANAAELLSKANILLRDTDAATANISEMKQLLIKDVGLQAWDEHVRELYRRADAATHRIHLTMPPPPCNSPCELDICLQETATSTRIKRLLARLVIILEICLSAGSEKPD